MKNYRSLSDQVAINECCSDFELGGMWSSHHRPGGSFLLVGCHADSISLSSYLLGSFRPLLTCVLMILRIYPIYGYSMQNTLHGFVGFMSMSIFMGSTLMK